MSCRGSVSVLFGSAFPVQRHANWKRKVLFNLGFFFTARSLNYLCPDFTCILLTIPSSITPDSGQVLGFKATIGPVFSVVLLFPNPLKLRDVTYSCETPRSIPDNRAEISSSKGEMKLLV